MLKYASGELIRPGDVVEYDGVCATVEFVVSDRSGDPGLDWYIDEFGGGAMLADPKVFGSVFVPGEDIADLIFLRRAEPR